MSEITADPNYLEGTFNGRPIAGYHFVQYGETQEYLESLNKAGVILVYREDNPPEEGKLTLTKPNPDPAPGTITVSPVANPGEIVVTDTTDTDDYFFQDVPTTPPGLQNLTGPVVYLDFVDKEAWSEGKIATAAELIAFRYSKFKLSIVTEKPSEGEFYTICIGTTEALKEYTASQGLVFDPENTEASSGIGFAVVEHKEHSALSPILLDMIDENTIETDELRSIGYQLSALLADECPGISDYCPVTVFSDSTTDTTVTDTTALIAGLKSYLEEIAPKMSDIDSLTDEEVASFNETLKSYKEALRQAGVATCLADTTLDPRTDTGMNLETLDPRTDTSLTALLDSYIAALDEKEATTTDATDPNNYVEGPLSQSELEKLRIPDNVEWNTFSTDAIVTDSTNTVVYLNFVDDEMWSEGKKAQAIELLQTRCKKKGVSVTFVTEKPESGKYSTVYVGAASVLKAYGADEDLSKQDYSDGVAYADTDMGLFGVRDYIWPTEVDAIAEQIKGVTDIDLIIPRVITPDLLLRDDDTTVTDTTDNIYADPGLCGPQPISWSIDPEKLEEMEKVKVRLAGFGEGPVHFHLFYDSEETDTPSRFELVRIGDSDWTNEQIASYATSMIEKSDYWNELQKALMREAVDEFRANPKMAQSYYEYQRSLTIISTMDAETEAVTSVQVASADDGGWRTIGTLNNPDGIDWKYQAGNLTGSGTASVVWHAQELGALGVWTDGTDNWTAVDGWFDSNWTMLGCGDFDGDGKDSVLMSLNGGLFYSVDLDGTLTSLGDLNWSGWEFGAVGDFAGDGKDDVVLFNKGLNCVVLLADGNADAWTSLGMIDSSDWAIAGAGDFNNDGIDDLLVRQNSTGIAGAYASADMSKWSTVSSDYLLA